MNGSGTGTAFAGCPDIPVDRQIKMFPAVTVFEKNDDRNR
jgi:hypothetical protein